MNLEARRAVEALRAGVPNRDAVQFLGAGQDHITKRFTAGLDRVGSGTGVVQPGFILGGEFGSGKSHILQYLKQEVLRRGFAASLVVISKETPLSDIDLVYKAAIRELTLPDRQGGDLNEVALRLNRRSPAYTEFFRWAVDTNSTLDPLFAATVLLFERVSSNDQLLDTIQGFWAGGRLKVSDIRRELRYIEVDGITVKPRKNAALAPMRFTFASRLMQAAGYKGWVLLLDEVELVASFPIRGRARAYANLVWLTALGDDCVPGLYTVAAATKEFTTEILTRKQDDVKIPLSLAEKDPPLAARAQSALKHIDEAAGTWESILPHDSAALDRVYREIRELYRRAFDWEGRDQDRKPYGDAGRSMRMHVREWITRWDLERLDPAYSVEIEADVLAPDLHEREGLEGFSDDDSANGKPEPTSARALQETP